MKVIKIFFVLFLMGFVASCASTQTPDSATKHEEEVKKLKQLGRKELIRLAVEKIKSGDNTFNPENYDRIRVMANKYSVFVSFDMKFKYVPQNSTYKYDVSVDLYRYDPKYQLLLGATSSPKSNPKGYRSKKDFGFFSPTEDSRKAIDFVLDTMKRHTKCGYYTKKSWPWDYEMIIRDKKDHYEIEEILPSGEGGYSIKKKSGEIFGQSHMHFYSEPNPIKLKEFEEVFEEIKD